MALEQMDSSRKKSHNKREATLHLAAAGTGGHRGQALGPVSRPIVWAPPLRVGEEAGGARVVA